MNLGHTNMSCIKGSYANHKDVVQTTKPSIFHLKTLFSLCAPFLTK